MAKYFTDDEFRCKCGKCEGLPRFGMHSRLLTVMDAIREKVGQPVIVTSGYRCPAHNAAVGGVPDSYHTQGIAADIYCDGVSVDSLAWIADECGADGIGRYYGQGFVHVDVRGWPARWEE